MMCAARARVACCLLAAALAVAAAAPAARADGDPASDILLSQDVFFPYSPPTSKGVAQALVTLTQRARRAGWPIKVAIIATAQDLGAAASLYNSPQQYANFLASEVGGPKIRLLVVMPAGFGGQNLGAGVNKALAGLGPINGGGDPLAKLALTAVARLSATDGHRVAVPPIDTSGAGRQPYQGNQGFAKNAPSSVKTAKSKGAGRGGVGWPIYAAPIILIAGGVALLARRPRRARSSES